MVTLHYVSSLEMFRWVVNHFGINESSNLFTEEEMQLIMGIYKGAKQAFATSGNWE